MLFKGGYTKIVRETWPALATLTLLVIAFGIYVVSEKWIDQANEQRHVSFRLAGQLRQSSDDLTRMARTYVATGDHRYKKVYQDILNIRDGKIARPKGYMYVYWDLLLAAEPTVQVGDEKAIALLDLMREANFASDELGKLAEAKANSDALTQVEVAAMKLVEDAGADAQSTRNSALRMLHDASYHRAKAAVMKPINEFYTSMEQRTAARVRNAQRSALFFRIVFILCSVGATIMLWRSHNALRKTLGAPAAKVHALIGKIGQGDFSTPVGVPAGMEDSVIAGLAATQTKLQSYETERRLAEAALRTTTQRLQEAQHIAQMGSWTEDLCSGDLNWSEEVFRLLELDPSGSAATYAALFERIHPDDRAAVKGAHRNSLETGTPYEITHRLCMPDGRIKWVLARGALAIDATGRPLRSSGTVQDISERKRVEEALQQSELRYRRFAEDLPLGIVITRDGLIRYVNHATVKLIGYAEAELVGKPFLPLVCAGDRSWVGEMHSRRMQGQEVMPSYIVGMLRSDGALRRWSVQTSNTDWEGRPSALGIITDITEAEKAEEALRIAAVAFESQEGMMVTDADCVILSVNRAFSAVTGYAAEDIVGKTPRLLKSGRHDPTFYQKMWQALERDGEWQGEIWDRRKNGEIYPKSLAISAVKGTAGRVTHYVATQHDITESKKAEEKIKELAFFDVLTGLPNRVTLHEQLAQVLRLAGRSKSQFALMLIDLDNFKAINDTLGHQAGDELLIRVAERLCASVRQSDLVTRLGGDEFVIVLPNITGPADVAHVAQKVVLAISEPYQIAGKDMRTSPSIGICLYPGDASDGEDMIKKADVAMYHAKSCGRGNYQFFKEDIQAAAVARLAIEADLRVALTKQQFVLHYQPQLDLRSGRLVGVEALIRWRHPERGMISPLEFIPIAEESGLILPIGNWVLEEACKQLAAWRQGGIEHIRMSVNLAASQFVDQALPLRIQSILAATGLPAACLDLEVTESMTMKSPEGAAAMMKVLTDKQLSLSMDDFGTGYSSLAYLKLFPISTLKIDRSFVKDIETDQNDADICDVVMLLAHKLGLDVVAEGVESKAQLKYLLSIGCEKIQGYLIAKPLPAVEAEQFIRNHTIMADLGTVELWNVT